MKRGRHRKTVTDAFPVLNLTPLIDTALTLLVIFMLTAPVVRHHELTIDLPRSQSQEISDDNNKQVSIWIDKQGNLSINGKDFSENLDIERLLLSHLKSRETVGVTIQADLDVSYGDVVRIVDRIKMMQGIEYVSLATQSA